MEQILIWNVSLTDNSFPSSQRLYFRLPKKENMKRSGRMFDMKNVCTSRHARHLKVHCSALKKKQGLYSVYYHIFI